MGMQRGEPSATRGVISYRISVGEELLHSSRHDGRIVEIKVQILPQPHCLSGPDPSMHNQ